MGRCSGADGNGYRRRLGSGRQRSHPGIVAGPVPKRRRGEWTGRSGSRPSLPMTAREHLAIKSKLA